MVSSDKTGKKPKAGYVYIDLSTKPDGTPVDLKPLEPSEAPITAFCYCAIPIEYRKTGRHTLIVDEKGIVNAKRMKGAPVTEFPRDLSTWYAVGD